MDDTALASVIQTHCNCEHDGNHLNADEYVNIAKAVLKLMAGHLVESDTMSNSKAWHLRQAADILDE